VFEDPLMSRGMPNFQGRLGIEDVEKIKAYIQEAANSFK
jgi:quinohemoprotein ethanol dehydrogenase